MLGEKLDATSAAYRVGYDDASHFNREYKRLFGAPPMLDVERLREVAMETKCSTLPVIVLMAYPTEYSTAYQI
jgi:AraC-like DNA-binding protein